MIKKIVLGLVAVAAIGVALPASAQGVVVGENRHGNVVVRPAGVVVEHRHHRHRVVWFDRHHHRHVSWR